MESNESKDLSYYKELKEKIIRLNKAYYDNDDPLVSDKEYDKLLLKLENIEAMHPEWQSDDSPTINVGGSASETFSKVEHEVKMESLQDVFSIEEVEAFIIRCNRELGYQADYVVEEKIDGLSIALEYRDGIFWQGSTRGNGQIGEDVTKNLLTMLDVPNVLKIDKPKRLVVRGEIFMPKNSFVKLNELQKEQGKRLFANPRNAAAGSIRQLNPEITRSRNLSLFTFNIQLVEGVEFVTHIETLDFLVRNGFKVIYASEPSNKLNDIESNIFEIARRRASLEYGIDGAVIKLNKLYDRRRLGSTSKYPRWAAAYKYPAEQVETRVLDIKVNVGRTGKLTPLAILEPVLVDGSTISKVTLHNADFIAEKDIRTGDIVLIQKAGDVIPEIVQVIKDKRHIDLIKFVMPKYCPICGYEVEQAIGEVDMYCINNNCPAQIKRGIEHFVSKDCMDISGMGEKNIELFLNNNFIKDISDIYLLVDYRDKLLELPLYGIKKVDNLLNAIEASKNNDISRLINGLGIKYIGITASQLIANNINNVEELFSISIDDLVKIPGLGEISARSIKQFFNNEINRELIIKLAEYGVNMNSTSNEQLDNLNKYWQDLKFVLTGSLKNYSRSDASKLISDLGGKVVSAISKNIDYVIVGENAGSKLNKARELNLSILNESQFVEAINNPDIIRGN